MEKLFFITSSERVEGNSSNNRSSCNCNSSSSNNDDSDFRNIGNGGSNGDDSVVNIKLKDGFIFSYFWHKRGVCYWES